MLGVQIALYFLLLDKIAEFHKDIWTMTIQNVLFQYYDLLLKLLISNYETNIFKYKVFYLLDIYSIL